MAAKKKKVPAFMQKKAGPAKPGDKEKNLPPWLKKKKK